MIQCDLIEGEDYLYEDEQFMFTQEAVLKIVKYYQPEVFLEYVQFLQLSINKYIDYQELINKQEDEYDSDYDSNAGDDQIDDDQKQQDRIDGVTCAQVARMHQKSIEDSLSRIRVHTASNFVTIANLDHKMTSATSDIKYTLVWIALLQLCLYYIFNK